MLTRFAKTAALAFAFATPGWAATPVNVNTADAATLASSLDGIGLSKAKAIVAYRDAYGPFKTSDDLGQVKGIGPATLARNHDAIRVSDAAPNVPNAPPPAKASHRKALATPSGHS